MFKLNCYFFVMLLIRFKMFKIFFFDFYDILIFEMIDKVFLNYNVYQYLK